MTEPRRKGHTPRLAQLEAPLTDFEQKFDARLASYSLDLLPLLTWPARISPAERWTLDASLSENIVPSAWDRFWMYVSGVAQLLRKHQMTRVSPANIAFDTLHTVRSAWADGHAEPAALSIALDAGQALGELRVIATEDQAESRLADAEKRVAAWDKAHRDAAATARAGKAEKALAWKKELHVWLKAFHEEAYAASVPASQVWARYCAGNPSAPGVAADARGRWKRISKRTGEDEVSRWRLGDPVSEQNAEPSVH